MIIKVKGLVAWKAKATEIGAVSFPSEKRYNGPASGMVEYVEAGDADGVCLGVYNSETGEGDLVVE